MISLSSLLLPPPLALSAHGAPLVARCPVFHRLSLLPCSRRLTRLERAGPEWGGLRGLHHPHMVSAPSQGPQSCLFGQKATGRHLVLEDP